MEEGVEAVEAVEEKAGDGSVPNLAERGAVRVGGRLGRERVRTRNIVPEKKLGATKTISR